MHLRVTLLLRAMAVLLGVLGSARLTLGVYAYRAANALERPAYTVLRTLSRGVELRRYAPYVIAETTVPTGSMRAASGQGFRSVAGYIFGKNTVSKRMAMTAPVRLSQKTGGAQMKMTAPVRMAPGDDATRVSFVMERGFTPRNSPRPTDRAVRVRNVQPHILAARTFNGPPPSEKRVARERERLLAALEADGLKPLQGADGAQTLVYGYHDPFITPSFLRRNEVCVYVEECAALRPAAPA